MSTERDFLFKPIAQTNITLYTYLVDAKIHKILTKNKTNRYIRILKKQRLGTLYKLNYENVFFIKHLSPPKKPTKESPVK